MFVKSIFSEIIFCENIFSGNIFGRIFFRCIFGQNIFGENIFGPLPCLTYNPHLFSPPSSVIFEDECYGRRTKRNEGLTDRTEHTMIVPFIVLDYYLNIYSQHNFKYRQQILAQSIQELKNPLRAYRLCRWCRGWAAAGGGAARRRPWCCCSGRAGPRTPCRPGSCPPCAAADRGTASSLQPPLTWAGM